MEADPLWKSCSPAFFTGLDPPTALYPATALVPLVTSTADANFKPPKAEPSPTPKNLPENTAKPPAQQVSPAKNTAAPSLGNINPVQKNADSDMQTAVDPSALKAGSNSHNAKDESGSSNGEMIDPLEDETASLATQPTSRAQVAASVGSDDLPEKFTADKGKSSQADPAKSDNSNEENDPSSQSDFAGVGFPKEAANSQQPHAFATVGGEPIVAVPQQDSPTDNHEIGPGANDGGDHNSSNGSVKDQPDIEISNTPPDPGTSGLQSGYTTASEPYANNDPGVAPVPLTTRIGGYIIQALSSPDAVLVNGESVTRGQDSKVISGTLVALQPNGDLMLGTSTVQVLLPSQLPSYNSFFAVGNQNLAASNNLLDQATYPAQAPQVYRIGTVRITAGGLPMTFAGTKIQAISDGAVIVGSMTYPAFPKPSGAGTESGTGYPAISDPKTRNMTNSSESAEAGGLFGSKSGDVGSNSSASVEAYLGSATIGRASWRLLCAVTVIVMIKQLP